MTTMMTLPHVKTRHEAWRVERFDESSKAKKSVAHPSALRRLFHRGEPSTFHRCLAVHMYFAGRPSALE